MDKLSSTGICVFFIYEKGDYVLKIALTGGIGSGKSTAAKYFAKFKIPIIDADKITHELFKANTTVYKKILSHFGKNFLTVKKNINRKKLRDFVFNNKKERMWLEQLIHPLVRLEMTKRTKLLQTPYCIMSIPLFFETKFAPRVDRILVIDCPIKTQINRICKRKNFTKKQAKTIIAAQIKRKERLKLANDIINNTGTLNSLKKNIKKFHKYYLSLS